MESQVDYMSHTSLPVDHLVPSMRFDGTATFYLEASGWSYSFFRSDHTLMEIQQLTVGTATFQSAYGQI